MRGVRNLTVAGSVVLAALSAVGAGALADGLPDGQAPRWGGAYIGGSLGVGLLGVQDSLDSVTNHTKQQTNTVIDLLAPTPTTSITQETDVTQTKSHLSSSRNWGTTGFLGSVYAGYNVYAGSGFILGIQADVSSGVSNPMRSTTRDSGTSTSVTTHEDCTSVKFGVTPPTSCPQSPPTNSGHDIVTVTSSDEAIRDSQTYEMPWTASAVLRGGFLVTPNTLVYGLGGVSLAHVDAVSFGDSFEKLGGIAGAGIEGRFGSKWGLRLEYRYTWFGSKDLSSSTNFSTSSTTQPCGPPTGCNSTLETGSTTSKAKVDVDTQTIQLGLTYYLN
jgi:opacity protein-like surface antigen